MYFDFSFKLYFVSKCPIDNKSAFGLGFGLVSKERWSFTWNNDDQILNEIHVLCGIDSCVQVEYIRKYKLHPCWVKKSK